MTDRTRDGGSGMLSFENNDETAAFCHREYSRVGISWAQVVHWNAVPFPTERRSPSTAEKREAVRWLPRLLKLLDTDALRVVALFGRVAHDVWERASPRLGVEVKVIETLHPSPLVRNNKPENPVQLRESFDQIASIIGC